MSPSSSTTPSTSSKNPPFKPSPSDLQSFRTHLLTSSRILALVGAGLSASSGLPTFRGAGGLWRSYSPQSLATPSAFATDPGLVWQFYAWRRHMALNAKPNAAHYALAKLAERRKGFVCLSQNVDGLSPRAGHPQKQIYYLHGSLFDSKCSNPKCRYIDRFNTTDPLCPALDVTKDDDGGTEFQAGQDVEPEVPSNDDTDTDTASTSGSNSNTDSNAEEDDDDDDKEEKEEEDPHAALGLPPLSPSPSPSPPPSDPSPPSSRIDPCLLPHCPLCTSLLRPGVTWFGEALSKPLLQEIDSWIYDTNQPIDLMLVIGTSAEVWPAAGYIAKARERGARVCVVNIDGGMDGEGNKEENKGEKMGKGGKKAGKEKGDRGSGGGKEKGKRSKDKGKGKGKSKGKENIAGLGEAGKNLRKGVDWVFVGDAGVVVPALLRDVIGEI